MTLDRRALLSAGALTAGTGFGVLAMTAAGAASAAGPREAQPSGKPARTFKYGLKPGSLDDQTAPLQAAIDAAAANGEPVMLPAGTLRTGPLRLPSGCKLTGAAGLSVLQFSGGAQFIFAKDAVGIVIEDIVFDGGTLPLDPDLSDGLLHFQDCAGLSLRRIEVRNALLNGMSLEGCSGRISDCTITTVSQAALRCLDSTGLDISHNHIADCGNNGILVWQSKAREDGTLISGNRIERIAARNGGTGEYGNGINVFRAGSVIATGNRISDCAYSAVRGNAASNIQILSNSCARIGEVAIYAEFGFQGAVIANNVIDGAATGIAVTNFNEGGRLAIVQGNLIRNLVRREAEPEDKRGDGITIEADTLVSGNVIENAPSCGISIGWGPFLRDCMVTNNLLRATRTGILVSSDPAAGKAMISGNMISGATDGAIRMMEYGRPVGPDLALKVQDGNGRIAVSANTVS